MQYHVKFVSLLAIKILNSGFIDVSTKKAVNGSWESLLHALPEL